MLARSASAGAVPGPSRPSVDQGAPHWQRSGGNGEDPKRWWDGTWAAGAAPRGGQPNGGRAARGWDATRYLGLIAWANFNAVARDAQYAAARRFGSRAREMTPHQGLPSASSAERWRTLGSSNGRLEVPALVDIPDPGGSDEPRPTPASTQGGLRARRVKLEGQHRSSAPVHGDGLPQRHVGVFSLPHLPQSDVLRKRACTNCHGTVT